MKVRASTKDRKAGQAPASPSPDRRGTRPLKDKKIFLQLHGFRGIAKFEKDLILLGAVIERCFSREVHCLITNRGSPADYQNAKKNAVSSPSPVTPSPFNPGSIGVDSPQGLSPGSAEPQKPITRGKAMAQAAKTTKTYGSTDVVEAARSWKIKIIHLEIAQRWVNKHVENIPVKDKNSGTNRSNSLLAKSRRLRGSYLKFESCSKHYRPVQQEFKSLPQIIFDSPPWTCPFYKKGDQMGKIDERGEGEERDHAAAAAGVELLDDGTPQDSGPNSNSKKKKRLSSEDLFGSKILTAGDIRRMALERKKAEAKKGYCELCSMKYENIDKHVVSDLHKRFVKDNNNYMSLDHVIKSGPNVAQFINDVREAYQAIPYQQDPCFSSDQVILVSEEENADYMLSTPHKQTHRRGKINSPRRKTPVKAKPVTVVLSPATRSTRASGRSLVATPGSPAAEMNVSTRSPSVKNSKRDRKDSEHGVPLLEKTPSKSQTRKKTGDVSCDQDKRTTRSQGYTPDRSICKNAQNLDTGEQINSRCSPRRLTPQRKSTRTPIKYPVQHTTEEEPKESSVKKAPTRSSRRLSSVPPPSPDHPKTKPAERKDKVPKLEAEHIEAVTDDDIKNTNSEKQDDAMSTPTKEYPPNGEEPIKTPPSVRITTVVASTRTARTIKRLLKKKGSPRVLCEKMNNTEISKYVSENEEQIHGTVTSADAEKSLIENNDSAQPKATADKATADKESQNKEIVTEVTDKSKPAPVEEVESGPVRRIRSLSRLRTSSAHKSSAEMSQVLSDTSDIVNASSGKLRKSDLPKKDENVQPPSDKRLEACSLSPVKTPSPKRRILVDSPQKIMPNTEEHSRLKDEAPERKTSQSANVEKTPSKILETKTMSTSKSHSKDHLGSESDVRSSQRKRRKEGALSEINNDTDKTLGSGLDDDESEPECTAVTPVKYILQYLSNVNPMSDGSSTGWEETLDEFLEGQVKKQAHDADQPNMDSSLSVLPNISAPKPGPSVSASLSPFKFEGSPVKQTPPVKAASPLRRSPRKSSQGVLNLNTSALNKTWDCLTPNSSLLNGASNYVDLWVGPTRNERFTPSYQQKSLLRKMTSPLAATMSSPIYRRAQDSPALEKIPEQTSKPPVAKFKRSLTGSMGIKTKTGSHSPAAELIMKPSTSSESPRTSNSLSSKTNEIQNLSSSPSVSKGVNDSNVYPPMPQLTLNTSPSVSRVNDSSVFPTMPQLNSSIDTDTSDTDTEVRSKKLLKFSSGRKKMFSLGFASYEFTGNKKVSTPTSDIGVKLAYLGAPVNTPESRLKTTPKSSLRLSPRKNLATPTSRNLPGEQRVDSAGKLKTSTPRRVVKEEDVTPTRKPKASTPIQPIRIRSSTPTSSKPPIISKDKTSTPKSSSTHVTSDATKSAVFSKRLNPSTPSVAGTEGGLTPKDQSKVRTPPRSRFINRRPVYPSPRSRSSVMGSGNSERPASSPGSARSTSPIRRLNKLLQLHSLDVIQSEPRRKSSNVSSIVRFSSPGGASTDDSDQDPFSSPVPYSSPSLSTSRNGKLRTPVLKTKPVVRKRPLHVNSPNSETKPLVKSPNSGKFTSSKVARSRRPVISSASKSHQSGTAREADSIKAKALRRLRTKSTPVNISDRKSPVDRNTLVMSKLRNSHEAGDSLANIKQTRKRTLDQSAASGVTSSSSKKARRNESPEKLGRLRIRTGKNYFT